MSALLDLAARCEAAEGPDRELDLSIALACGVAFKQRPKYRRGHYIGSKPVQTGWKPDPLRYTASLDAAMTLVPEGCSVSIEAIVCGDESRCIQADVWSGARPELAMAEVWSTPALALCAAALRARASGEQQ